MPLAGRELLATIRNEVHGAYGEGKGKSPDMRLPVVSSRRDRLRGSKLHASLRTGRSRRDDGGGGASENINAAHAESLGRNYTHVRREFCPRGENLTRR